MKQHILLGDPREFAIECELWEGRTDVPIGRFYFWINQKIFGDAEDVIVPATPLIDVHISLFADVIPMRPELLDMPKDTCFTHIWSNEAERRRCEWLANTEGFDHVESIAFRGGDVLRIIWREKETSEVHEHRVPFNWYFNVVSAFCEWYEAAGKSRLSYPGKDGPSPVKQGREAMARRNKEAKRRRRGLA